jgi:hypothetical protein
MQRYKELFEERAAIMEFDGKMSRDEANLRAKEEVLAIYRKDGGTKEADLNFSLRSLMFKK